MHYSFAFSIHSLLHILSKCSSTSINLYTKSGIAAVKTGSLLAMKWFHTGTANDYRASEVSIRMQVLHRRLFLTMIEPCLYKDTTGAAPGNTFCLLMRADRRRALFSKRRA